MGNRVRIERKSIGRRGLALLLALVTAITSWSLDWNALKVQAADNSSELSTPTVLSNGGDFSMVYTNTNANRVSVNTVYFKFLALAGKTYSYNVTMTQSGGTPAYSADAVQINGGSAIAEDTTLNIPITIPTDHKIYLDSNDTLEITVTLGSSGEGNIEYYTSSSGDAFAVSVEDAPNPTDLPQATVVITGDDIVVDGSTRYITMAVGESYQLGYSINYSRDVYFSVDTESSPNSNAVTVSPQGLLTAASTGVAHVEANTAQSGDIKGTLTVQVIDATLSNSSFDFTGQPITLSDSDIAIAGLGGTIPASSVFKMEYANNTNVGTATVTLSGEGDYAGYQKTLSYTITQKDLRDIRDRFNQGTATYAVDTATSAVTISNVMFNDVPVVQNKDFTATAVITGQGATPGYYNYDVTITGIGNYKETITQSISVAESAGLQIGSYYTYDLDETEMFYDGTNNQMMDVTVYDQDRNEVIVIHGSSAVDGVATATNSSTHETFTVTYTLTTGNTFVGPGEVAVKVESNIYSGELTGKTYKIRQEITDFAIQDSALNISGSTGVYTYKYTGNPITPSITVRNAAGTQLSEGTDYTVEYINNTGRATGQTTATIAVTGTGLYSGQVEKTFTIAPPLSDAEIIFDGKNSQPANRSNGWASAYSKEYTGGQITPTVSLKFNGQKITTGFTCVFGENINVSTGGTVTITTAAGSKFGVQSQTASFNIGQKSLSSGDLTIGDTSGIVYDGTEKTLTAIATAADPGAGEYKLVVGGTVLTRGVDYTAEYSNNTNAGQANLLITGMGNYKDTKSKAFPIGQLELDNPGSGNTVTVQVGSATYSGMPVEPTVTVKLTKGDGSQITLTEDTDFIVTYSDNIRQGENTATATIRGIQNYTGELSQHFSIEKRNLLASSVSYKLDGTYTANGSGGTGSLTFYTDVEKVWNGYERKPGLVIKDGDTVLLENKDYRLSWSNNEDVSKDSSVNLASVTVTGIGNYDGAATVTFKFSIVKCPIDADRITVDPGTDPAHVSVTITDTGRSGSPSDQLLVKDRDYTIKMDNSRGGGVKTATITGIGKYYTGTYNWTYTVGRNLASATVSMRDPVAKMSLIGYETSSTDPLQIPFLGSQKPNIFISGYNGGQKINDLDGFAFTYTVTQGTDEYAAGSCVTVRVAATEKTTDYYGYKDLYYKIVPAKILTEDTPNYNQTIKDDTHKDYLVKIDGSRYASYSDSTKKFSHTYSYEPAEISPDIAVSYKPYSSDWTALVFGNDYEYTLTPGVDFTVTPVPVSMSGNVGTTKEFTITGTGNFDGQVNIVFNVANRSLADAEIATIPAQVYEGSAITPDPVVTYNRETLTKDVDYTVEYHANDTPGTASLTIKPKAGSPYDGEKTATFNIVKTELTNDNTTVTILEKYAYNARAREFNTTDPDSDSYIDKLVRVKYGNQTLKYEDQDFDIDYENNIYPGVAKLKILPGHNNKYSVSETNAPYGEYTIYLNLTDTGLYKVVGIQNTADHGWNNAVAGKYVYTPAHDNADAKWEYLNGGGERLTMAGVKIRPLNAQGHEDTEDHDLVMGTNFTETWNSMTVPGRERSIVIAGKGATNNYCIGTISILCEIYGDLSQATVEVAEIQAYRGDTAVIKPEPSVIFDGQRLPGSYYQTTYYHVSDDYHSVLSDNNTRTITVTAITDAGYYTGSATAEYRILYNLNDAVISGVNSSYSYRDASTVPEPTVDMTGKANGPLEKANGPLEKKGDYVLTKTSNNPADPTCTAAGSTITYTISAKDGVSYGSKSISYTITGESLANGTLSYELTPASYTYTGSEIKPVPTNVALDGRPLTRGTDYYLSWSNNVNAGTGLITFNGMGNYTGRQTKNFTINPKDINSADIVAVFPSSYQYQGGAIVKPTDMYLTDRGANKTLRLATDIQQTAWDNATGVTDSAKVTIEPLGTALGANYTGRKAYTYSIVPLDLQSATVRAETTEATYDGDEKTPSLTVSVGGRTLTSGEDYVVSSIVNAETGAATPHPVDAGTYTLIISPGKDYIINSKTVDFTINPKELNTSGFTSTYTYTTEGEQQTKNRTETIRFAYTGAECRMDSVSLRDNALALPLGSLTEGEDFEISYSDNITDSAAEGDDDAPTVTITGKGNYTGTIDKKYNIGTDISDITRATLTNTTFTYNGNEQKPTVTVRYISGPHNGETLPADKYDVVFKNASGEEVDPIHAGTYDVIISGKNGYYGNVKDSSTNNTPQYTINQKVSLTAAETNKLTFALNLSKEAGMYVSNYTGSEVKPEVTIYDTQISRSVPVDSSNYTVEYEHNTNVSTASTPANVRITMRGDYTTYTKNINFKIKPIAFNNTTRVTVHYPDPSNPYYSYIADEIEPEVTVTQTVNGAEYTLVEDTDYEVTYTDNVVPGDATVRVTGKGNFSTESTRVERFRIKADLDEVFPLNGVPLGDDSSITIGTQFYAGASIDPTATVVIEGETLTQGGNVASDDVDFYTTPMDPSDYDLANNIGYVYLTGCGRYYTGTCTASFALSDDVETLLSVAFYETNADGENEVVTSVPYNGATQKLRGMIVDQNGAAVYTFDASTDGVTYSNSTDGATCKNVGTVTVTVPFTYMGSDYEKTGTYSITTTSLADATVTCPANVIYNGTAREPVIVSYDGRTLTKNTDYTITYTNNTNPGVTAVSGNNVTATYTINGAGNFTGTREGTFTVRVQDMSGLTATPGANSMRLNWDAKGYVTGYKLRVYNSAGTMLNEYNIANKNVSTYTVNNLTAGTSYSFRLIGYVQTTADTYLSNPQVIVAATSMATPTITGSVSGGKPAVGLPSNQGDAKIIIYRSTASGSGYNLLAVISDGRSVFRDNSAVSGRTYYYIAKYATVVNGTLQQSDASNEVTVTAP